MVARTRGYLPHNDTPDETYFVTFRLYDSLPASVILSYRQELEWNQRLKEKDPLVLLYDYQAKIERSLDSGYGQCFLRNPEVAKIVADAIQKQDGEAYSLHAFTIMPNHVHALLSLNGVMKFSEIVQKWKGSSAFYSNRILGRSGVFWQREYFERTIKSRRHFEFTIRYIYNNPVKAGLCKDIHSWPWTRSSSELHPLLNRFFL